MINNTPVISFMRQKLINRAHTVTKISLSNGNLIRPKRCQFCSQPNRECSDGRSWLQAHHDDHSKPLEVKWLCPACHRRVTPLRIGENHHKSKLNLVKIKAIMDLRKLGWGRTNLSSLFEVNISTIRKVLNGKNWLKARGQSHDTAA